MLLLRTNAIHCNCGMDADDIFSSSGMSATNLKFYEYIIVSQNLIGKLENCALTYAVS